MNLLSTYYLLREIFFVMPNNEKMILIDSSCFEMGAVEDCNNVCIKNIPSDWYKTETPQHKVFLPSFWIDIFPVTCIEFYQFVQDTKYYPSNWKIILKEIKIKNGNLPVTNVNWYDAVHYAKWTGKRLPTEAEWECAARGGMSNQLYTWGNDRPSEKNCNYGSKIGYPNSKGLYPPNHFGLYDMLGNVWEWCLDEFDDQFYANSPNQNPCSGDILEILENFAEVKTNRIMRGGSWYQGSTYLRSSHRGWAAPNISYNSYGFRCALSN